MIIEVCTEDLAQSLMAEQSGAHRIELCADLHNGGTTPSFGMIRTVSFVCSIPVFAMIRPRGGNFVYTESEMDIMRADISAAAAAGARGVVFGALTSEGDFHVEHNTELLRTARIHNLQVTFHRAIDVCNNPLAVVELLAELGFDHVLTSGGKASAEQGVTLIEQMVKVAGNRIQLMAGAGIHPDNVLEICKTGVAAIHFTARKRLEEKSEPDMGERWEPDGGKVKRIVEKLFAANHKD